MAIEHISRILVLNGSQSSVEDGTASITELVFGKDTTNGILGYSTDYGTTWTWITASATNNTSGNYRQFLYTTISGNPTFLTDSDGNLLTVLLDLE